MTPPVRRKLLVSSWTLLALAFALAETAFAGSGIAPPEPASPNAERIRDVYWLVLGIIGVIFVLVEAALIFFVVRFRGRGRTREVEGPQIIGHRNLELIWTAVPVLILALIAGFVFYKLPGVTETPEARAAGDNVLRIKVEGRQFYWRYVYPNGHVAVNELQVPVGRTVELELTAPAYDVIHSWWIPSLGGKIDAVPGRTNYTWFEVERPGLYRGQCAEFCGSQHALMVAQVRAVPQSEFLKAMGQQPVELGEQTWLGACGPCHGDQAEGLIGPSLQDTGLDAQQIELVVRNGRGAMPPVGKGWDEVQMRRLIGYVRREFGRRPQSGG